MKGSKHAVKNHTWSAELRDVRHNNEGPGEVTAVSGLSRLHSLGPQDDLQGARDGSTRQLRLRLLDTHLSAEFDLVMNLNLSSADLFPVYVTYTSSQLPSGSR